MRRIILWQYILIAAAWLIAFCSLSLPGAELNGFLGWHDFGTLDTKHFIQFLFALPRQVIKEWNDPNIRGGIHPSGFPAPTTFAYGDLFWLAAVILGLLAFIFAPIIVKKHTDWSRASLVVLRVFSPIILILPLSTLAPPVWGFPVPHVGLYLLALAHLFIFSSLILCGFGNSQALTLPR